MVHVINLPHDIMCLYCITCYVPFMSLFFGCLTSSWSAWCHIVHVINLPHEILCLYCYLCGLWCVEHSSHIPLSLYFCSFPFAFRVVLSVVLLLSVLVCHDLITFLFFVWFLLAWVMSYGPCHKFTTWYYVPVLSNLLCPFHVIKSLDVFLLLGLSDVILYMW